MSQPDNWTILGDTSIANLLRNAAAFVDADRPMTITTDTADTTPDAIGVGPSVYASSVQNIVPYFNAFEAIDNIQQAIADGSVGKVYGCYASMRVPRGTSSDALMAGAVGPILAVCRDLLPQPVTRAWARRASLFAPDDALFITLRLADETIVTIEALASGAASSREILIEVTGSERVLRAEPTAQGIRVEPLGREPMIWPWWEDLAERFLALVNRRAATQQWLSGDDLRAVWDAIQHSADTGNPVDVTQHA